MNFSAYLKEKTNFLNVMHSYVLQYANYLNNNQITRLYVQSFRHIHHVHDGSDTDFGDLLKRNHDNKPKHEAKNHDNADSVSHSMNTVLNQGFAMGRALLKNKTLKKYAHALPSFAETNHNDNDKGAKDVARRIKMNPNGFYDYIISGAKDGQIHAHLVSPLDLADYIDIDDNPQHREHYLDY